MPLLGAAPSPPATSPASVAPPSAPPAAPTLGPRRLVHSYGFTDATAVRYTASHRLGKVQATSNRIHGTITISDNEIGTPFTLRVPFGSFRGNPSRDVKAMQALGALRNPEAVLVVERLAYDWKTFVPGAVSGRLDFKGKAHGTLTLRGVTRPVTIAMSGWAMPVDASVQASFSVSLKDYGIKAPRWMLSPVHDQVDLEVEGVASRMVN